MNTGTKVTTGDTATTHDIELPPMPTPPSLIQRKDWYGAIQAYARSYGMECARAAIEADRKRRGEPVAWLYEDELPDNYPYEAMFPYSKVDGVRMFPVYAPQPAEHGRSEHGMSTTQALITLGKVIAGYRPGEEGWTEEDQQAYDAAMLALQPLSNSDIFSNPVKHDLYKTGDPDAPEQILDRNGVVVLQYCKRCGKAEAELFEPCEPVKCLKAK